MIYIRLRVVSHAAGRESVAFFTRACVSLALLSLRKNGGLLVVYICICIFLFYLQGKFSLL